MTARALKLGGIDELLIFIRPGGWYPVQGVKGVALDAQAAQHAALNLGTIRVEDRHGNVLWKGLADA